MASTQQRIKMEIKQLKLHPESFFEIFVDQESIYNIHFSILGPIQTPFEGGYYHGLIELPENYPFSPPDIQFFTENGRFVQYKRICTNFTSFHPEQWSSSWGIRVILLGLRSMFDEETPGAVGSIVIAPDQRRALAVRSKQFKCDVCGCDHAELNLYDSELCKKEDSNAAEEGAAGEAEAQSQDNDSGREAEVEEEELVQPKCPDDAARPARDEASPPSAVEASFLQELYNIVFDGRIYMH